jgi:hypothetical protein
MASPERTTTISEMIHRFRTAKPTSRAHREAMRRNGDLPVKMWWEVQFKGNERVVQQEIIQEIVNDNVKK